MNVFFLSHLLGVYYRYDQPDHLAMIKCSICSSFNRLCRHFVSSVKKVPSSESRVMSPR